jgi:hypothetical protein
MTRATALTAALVASLIANVYLLIGRPSDGARMVGPPSHAERRGELPPLPRPATNGAPADREAPAREAALTAQLLQTQAALEAQRMPEFRAHPDRSPEVEAQVKAALDRVYATTPDPKPIYTVECHGAACAFTFDDGQDPAVWLKPLQGTKIDEFVTVQLNATGATVHVASPDAVLADRYVQSVFGVIRNSPAVAECKQRFTAPGEVVLAVVLDTAHDVHVTMQGSLADQDFGACLRPVLDRAPAQVPPPPATVHSLPDNTLVVSVASPNGNAASPRCSTAPRCDPARAS